MLIYFKTAMHSSVKNKYQMSTRFVVYSNGENSYSASRLILQNFPREADK